jgi:response regulator RpfG family c-di-GMP phosphodiesterase
MEPKTLAKILCVDDEQNVLDGLSLNLRRRFEVLTATSGAAALEILQQQGAAITVVVSDMRMPGMDGATFLSRARQALPDAVRILLTGQAELESAIAAVNEGRIFRFLTKPCPPAVLIPSLEAAVEQHRLITAEKVLLEQTLHGSVKTLTEVLSLTNPASFGRATRIKQHVTSLLDQLGIRERWQVEVAAMLSQLGSITLPPETVEKAYYGRPLTEQEQGMVSRAPAVTEQLLANIPRLEEVRAILAACSSPRKRAEPASRSPLVDRGAKLLKIALDFDALETQGDPTSRAIDIMRGRRDQYDPEILEAFAAIRRDGGSREDVRELPLSALRAGMIFAEDVKMTNGTLLVARGAEVTTGFAERVRNFLGTVKEPVRVIIPTRK